MLVAGDCGILANIATRLRSVSEERCITFYGPDAFEVVLLAVILFTVLTMIGLRDDMIVLVPCCVAWNDAVFVVGMLLLIDTRCVGTR